MKVADNITIIQSLIDSLDAIQDKNYLTHGIHPYPAKFVPQIPGAIIDAYSKPGDTILDPFCGSGTTLLESIIRGRNALGIDINPIATLISRAKVTPLKDHERRVLIGLIVHLEMDIKNIRQQGR